MNVHEDSLKEILRAMDEGRAPDIAWSIRWSRCGQDPVAAAFAASRDPEAMRWVSDGTYDLSVSFLSAYVTRKIEIDRDRLTSQLGAYHFHEAWGAPQAYCYGYGRGSAGYLLAACVEAERLRALKPRVLTIAEIFARSLQESK